MIYWGIRLPTALRSALIRGARRVWVSKPKELPLRLLAEPGVNVSAHRAPIDPTRKRFYLAHSLLPFRVGGELNRSTRPLRSKPITGSSTLLQVGPSPVCASVLWALIFFSWPSPLASQPRVPAVPHKSLDRARAISMPDTIHPVGRLPMDLSRRWSLAPVLMSPIRFSTL